MLINLVRNSIVTRLLDIHSLLSSKLNVLVSIEVLLLNGINFVQDVPVDKFGAGRGCHRTFIDPPVARIEY